MYLVVTHRRGRLAALQQAHVQLLAAGLLEGAPSILAQQGRVQRLATRLLHQACASQRDLLPQQGGIHRLRAILPAQGVRAWQAALLLQQAVLLLALQLAQLVRTELALALAQRLPGAAQGRVVTQRALLTHPAAQAGLAAVPGLAAQARGLPGAAR